LSRNYVSNFRQAFQQSRPQDTLIFTQESWFDLFPGYQ
jgi:hypothetical protein